MRLIVFSFFFSFCSLFASDVVIELLVTNHDNKLWQTKNQMHMTIGHIKDVNQAKLMEALTLFSSENSSLLKKNVHKGFVVESFNTNGFNNGYHILEADPETTARFASINSKLYQFLIDQQFGSLTDKTKPKTINPKGYTPHIEFLETSSEKIPVQGDVLYFKGWRLKSRIIKN